MLAGCALVLAGCGGGDGGGTDPTALRSPDPTGSQAEDAGLVQGRDVYEQRCVSCHGVEGDGGVGGQLSDGATVENYPAIEDEIEVVADGLGQMPGFGSTLSAAEIEAVVRYTREVL